MNKVVILRGLPASGKTTKALELVKQGYLRVNKDDLRAMVHGGKWSKENEKEVLEIRDNLIRQYMKTGKNIVVDDTNLAPHHLIQIDRVVREYNGSGTESSYEVRIDDSFLSVSVDECIRRDAARTNPVGEKVILQMYYQYLHREGFYEPPREGLRPCIIVDIDGTIAEKGDRSPFDWKRVGEDAPKQVIIDIVKSYKKANPEAIICFFSGRDESCWRETQDWIYQYFDEGEVYPLILKMRREGDNRSDAIVKKELFYSYVHGLMNPLFVIDDRKKVVDMWRRDVGLTCLEVADHRF